MTSRVLFAALMLAACGKSGKEESTVEPSAMGASAHDATQPNGTKTSPTPAGSGAQAVTQQASTQPAPPAKEDDRSVYSLVDNRLAGHLTRNGGLVLPAGSAGFAKYVRIGNQLKGSNKSWSLRQTVGDVKVAKMTGKTATVYTPLTKDQAATTTIRIRAHADGGSLSLTVNDNKKELTSKLTDGWTTAEFTVPSGYLREGENAITMNAKHDGVAVAWVQIGGEAVGDDGSVAFYDGKALSIPKGGAMSWYAAVPDKAHLDGTVTDAGCKVHVLATADDGTTAEGDLSGSSKVDLSPVAGKAVRLDLSAQACAAHVANAQIALDGKRPEVKRGDAPKYVVFVVMDSLRADRVRPFNPKARPETPNFEKLAESSAFFVNDYVQGNESQVSHAAMWSSNYLAKHKAIEMSDKLADKWVTIDEVAKKAKMFAGGASGNGYIRPSRGFGSGWDKFDNHIEKDLGLKGADIMAHGLSFVEKKKDSPWFLYLGFIDTHVTWRAKQPWMGKYDGGYRGRFQVAYGDDGPDGSDGTGLSEAEHDHVRALYDSNVSYQDDLMGKLVDKLKDWGIYDQTMIIITADHGDEQWEDGRVGHGGSERETLLHVPLVIHYPPMFPAGMVTEGTENIDIVPTMADALGVEPDGEWQGQSLIPIANGQGGYPLMSFSSQYENWHTGRIGKWKVKTQGSGPPRVFDLTKDPGERTDLYGKAEIGTRLLLDPMWTLRQWNVEWKKSKWGNASNVSAGFAADMGE